MTFGYQLICRPAITFLYRAPMIELNPLNTRAMADNYVENIKPNEEKVLDARVSRDEFAKDAESMRLSILGKDTKVK